MRLLHENLAANETSAVFEVPGPGDVWVDMDGDMSAQTVTMSRSHTNASGSFDNLYADGTLVTFTLVGEQRLFSLGSGFYRFTCSNGGTPAIDIYVDGVARFAE